MEFTDLTASNVSRMPFVTSTLGAPVRSQSRLPYTVSSHSPFFCEAPPLFINVRMNPDARNVCTRGKNHYDPQQVQRLFPSEIMGTENIPGLNDFQSHFQQTHESQASRMYFV